MYGSSVVDPGYNGQPPPLITLNSPVHSNMAVCHWKLKPNPALLALHNPYDPGQRHHLTYPLDFSLYNGKYYLYFGPVPALFLLVISFLVSTILATNIFAFAFASGILLFQSLLIIKIWKRFFKNIPAWIIPFCILFCGLVSPIPWILTLAQSL